MGQQQLWQAADIFKACGELGATNSHLNSRVRAGLLTPTVQGKGRGSKNYFDAYSVLLYALSMKIEMTGADMHDAFSLASIIMDNFHDCIDEAFEKVPYIVCLSGPLGYGRTILPSGTPPKGVDTDNRTEMRPFPGISIWIDSQFLYEVVTKNTGRLEFMSFMNAGAMVRNAIISLGVSDASIKLLEERSRHIEKRDLNDFNNERAELLEQYAKLTTIALMTDDPKAREELRQAAEEIKKKLKI